LTDWQQVGNKLDYKNRPRRSCPIQAQKRGRARPIGVYLDAVTKKVVGIACLRNGQVSVSSSCARTGRTIPEPVAQLREGFLKFIGCVEGIQERFPDQAGQIHLRPYPGCLVRVSS
jgi:hypothetical protein